MNDWPQVTKEVSAQLRNLRADAPEVMRAFAQFAQAATSAKALDAKTKELIALGIAVAVRCDDCIAFHVKAALERGRLQRGGDRNAEYGDLYGRWALGHVRDPCARSPRPVFASRTGELIAQAVLVPPRGGRAAHSGSRFADERHPRAERLKS